ASHWRRRCRGAAGSGRTTDLARRPRRRTSLLSRGPATRSEPAKTRNRSRCSRPSSRSGPKKISRRRLLLSTELCAVHWTARPPYGADMPCWFSHRLVAVSLSLDESHGAAASRSLRREVLFIRRARAMPVCPADESPLCERSRAPLCALPATPRATKKNNFARRPHRSSVFELGAHVLREHFRPEGLANDFHVGQRIARRVARHQDDRNVCIAGLDRLRNLAAVHAARQRNIADQQVEMGA